jgi:peptidyl-dipeptidase Dcp
MNVLLENWDTPFGLPPFARIRDEDFGPAFDEALARARAKIAAIADGPGTSFAEVIEALELAEGDLDRVAGVFYNLAGADSTEAREALMRELAPKMSAFSSEVTNNKALWAKIDALWQGREALGLTAEQGRVLDLYRRMFVRSGAALEGAAAERLTAVKARLAVLGTQFSQNLLADERGWFMELADADLVALPGFVQDAARAAGAEKGTGPVVTLSRSLIVPFLQFSPNRALREKAYEAWVRKGRERGRDGQPRHRGRDPGAAVGAGEASGLRGFRGLQAGAGDGEDPRSGAGSLDAGLATGAGQGAGRCGGAGGHAEGGRPSRPAGALGLALLFREAPEGGA